MKTIKTILFILSLVLPLKVLAQPFYIDWHKVSGGGGTSVGGVFSLSGTIGQHDAGGPFTNNSYVLTSGYWSLLAIQTPGAPDLTITLTNELAIVSWPAPSAGYSLQTATNLTSPTWQAVRETVTNNGTINYIWVNPPTGNKYYRLFYP
jgi:hypothetical protein